MLNDPVSSFDSVIGRKLLINPEKSVNHLSKPPEKPST